MKAKKIKAYNIIDFIVNKCKFMVNGINQVVVKGDIIFEQFNLEYGKNKINRMNPNYNWQAYDFYATLQKPSVEKPRQKGVYGDMPHFLIPFTTHYNEYATELQSKIETVGDFISIFYPAPVDIKFSINFGKKIEDFRKLGDRYDEVINMPIKSVEYLKTCIRINV